MTVSHPHFSAVPPCILLFGNERKGGAGAGFTLIELMIVLVILAVVLVFALPGFSNIFLGTRLTNYSNEIVSSVHLARGEAIKRNADITLCASADGATCSAANAWGAGWIVLDTDDRVVSSNAAVAPGFLVVEASNINTLVFDGSGLVSTAATFKICRQSPSIGSQEREVLVTNIGRTSVSTNNNAESCP